ncbi:MAG: glycosyltransferase [Firmicutes bacterium]|nr:glycosyltransferase [Bacillota bacterium]MCL5014514.1 glycosyltransferase [Bacillota bacterium]
MSQLKELSVCVSTLGRLSAVDRLLQSLSRMADQEFDDFEVVIVDQNPDSRIRNLAADYANILPRVLYVATPGDTGSSKGRNVAAKGSRGRWMLFSDDDAWMIPGMGTRIRDKILQDHENILWLGRMVNQQGQSQRRQYPRQAEWIRDAAALWRVSAFCMISGSVFGKIGPFDERLGLGTYFGGDEDTDLLLRAMAQGFPIRFEPRLTFGHVANPHPSDDKVLGQARGRGALVRKYETTSLGQNLRQSLNQYLWDIRWKRPVVRMLGRNESARHKDLILSGVAQGYRDWQG